MWPALSRLAYHPQARGKVERLHQTLKRYLTRQAAAKTLVETLDPSCDYKPIGGS